MSDDADDMVELPMVCTCTPEGAAAASVLREAVKARLLAGSASLRPVEVTDANFLSALCTSMRWDWSANVAGIRMDQWFVVVVEQLLPTNDERRIAVQCDAVEDGLAAVWDFLAT